MSVLALLLFIVPPITNNMFDNVLLVFARIGKLMCTYINKCINKLKKIFSYKLELVYMFYY